MIEEKKGCFLHKFENQEKTLLKYAVSKEIIFFYLVQSDILPL